MTAPDPKLQLQASESASFTDTLTRVLDMARKAEASTEFREEFREHLQALLPESKARLSVLLNIGREAHGLALRTALLKNATLVQEAAPLDVLALCETKTLSQRYLERGLAAACAGKLTLDTPGSQRSRVDRQLSVDERAWSRFGRELAGSEPSNWSWFACFKGRSRVLDKLYVRHGSSHWWSFATSIDRPLREQVDVDRRRATTSRGSGHGSSLESLLTQEGSPSRRALRRALTSIHARLGKVRAGGQTRVATG